MDLSSHSAAFVAHLRQFRRSFPTVLALQAVSSELEELQYCYGCSRLHNVKRRKMVRILFQLCVSICAQLLPSLQGEGQGWGLYIVHYQKDTDPTPASGHPSPRRDYSLYTSEIIGQEGQQQPAQGNALGTMVVCY